MNSSALTHKTPHPARSIRTHLDHEHEIISKELITLRSIVFSEVHDVFAEIDFRNRLEWITRSIETHLTSEERVVLKYLYTADDYSIQKNCIENVCQINREIDRVLDELDRCPWSKIQAIQSLVSLLEHLFNLINRYPTTYGGASHHHK